MYNLSYVSWLQLDAEYGSCSQICDDQIQFAIHGPHVLFDFLHPFDDRDCFLTTLGVVKGIY